MKLPHLVRSIGVYTLLGFAPLAVNFFLLPLYTTKLDPTEFGILTTANISYTFATLFIALGMETGYARLFFDHASSPRDLHRLLATTLWAITGMTVVLAAVFALFGKAIFAALWEDVPFGRFGAPIVWGAFVQMIYAIVYAHYRNHERLAVVASLSLIGSMASVLGSVVAVLGWQATAFGAFVGRVAGLSLFSLLFLGLLFREMTTFRPRWLFLRQLLAYGLPLLMYTLSAYLLFNGDRILMARFFTLHDLGLYALAALIVSPLEIVLQAGQQAVQPSFYRQLNERNPRAEMLVGGFYNANVLGSIICSVGLILLSGPVLQMVRGTQYLGCVRYLPILCLAQLMRILFTGCSFFIFYSKKTTILPVVTALSILAGLAGVWATRGMLGQLSIAFGVLSWKLAQWLMTAAAVQRFSRDFRPNHRAVYGAVLAMAAYVLVLEKTPPEHSQVVGIVGGLLVVGAAGIQLVRNLRSGWWVDVRSAPASVQAAADS